jgi:hypothetical protein
MNERWMICTHLEQIRAAKFVPDYIRASGIVAGARVTIAIKGEALCPWCLEQVEAGTPNRARLVIACGACVRERWKIEGAS